MWNVASSPFQFRSPYPDSSFARQEFFNQSSNGQDTPLFSPATHTAFTPCKPGCVRPYANGNYFPIFKGILNGLH